MALDKENNDKENGLVKHKVLVELLNESIKLAADKDRLLAVIMISLHQLKKINAEFGHAQGDELIKSVSERLIKLPIKYRAVSSFHGTNFVLVFEGVKDKAEVEKIVVNILHVLHQPILILEQQHIPSVTAGISLYPDNASEPEELIDKSFQAAHQAHLNGMQTHVFYAQELGGDTQINRILENDLLLALQNNEFRLLYQPQVNVKTNKIEGAEALARWFNVRLGEISPVFFIPIAEGSGLIGSIGEWVIEKACSRIHEWLEANLIGKDFFISINVSPIQLESEQFSDYLLNVMSKYKIPSEMIQIELTETALMQNMKSSIKQLKALKKKGIKIAVDDFGTGYSSLTHLSNLPVDIVKLDRSFISSINDSTTQMVVKSVVDLAHQLDLLVTAEGVETEQQLNILKEFNCDLIQGFYFSMPVSEERFLQKLKASGKDKK